MSYLITIVLTAVFVALITSYVTFSAVKVTINKKSWDAAERLVATNGGVLNGITSNIDFDYLLSDTFYIKAKKDPVHGYSSIEIVNTPIALEQAK